MRTIIWAMVFSSPSDGDVKRERVGLGAPIGKYRRSNAIGKNGVPIGRGESSPLGSKRLILGIKKRRWMY